jgi:hypothetical protein
LHCVRLPRRSRGLRTDARPPWFSRIHRVRRQRTNGATARCSARLGPHAHGSFAFAQALKCGLVTASRRALRCRLRLRTWRPRAAVAARGVSALSAGPWRALFARLVLKQVRKRAPRAHYPAPYAIVDLWVKHGGRGAAAYRAEAESIGALLVTRTSRNLVRVFELRERLRNLAPKRISRGAPCPSGRGRRRRASLA